MRGQCALSQLGLKAPYSKEALAVREVGLLACVSPYSLDHRSKPQSEQHQQAQRFRPGSKLQAGTPSRELRPVWSKCSVCWCHEGRMVQVQCALVPRGRVVTSWLSV